MLTTVSSKATSSRVAALRLLQRTSCRALSSKDTPYKATEVARRDDEMGRGGKGSEAGLKVALFGASGFLGGYVCTELGK